MGGYEHTIVTTRTGSIVSTGFGCPRCYRVLDAHFEDRTEASRVDLPTAYKLLAHIATTSSRRTPPTGA